MEEMDSNTTRRWPGRGRADGTGQGHSISAHPTWGRSEECSEITYTVREPSACSCGSASMVSASGDKSRWYTRSKNTIPSPSGPHRVPKPPLHLPLTPNCHCGQAWPPVAQDETHLIHSFPKSILKLRQGMKTTPSGIRRENRASC